MVREQAGDGVGTGRQSAHIWVAVFLTLLAAGLRLYGLDRQGLWNDEGLSYVRSSQSLARVFADLPAEQMPLYYILLSLWMSAFGRSIWAMRLFSALPGILLVPLGFHLGKRWFGARTGLISALFMAISAPLIYQAQTMRAYPLATLCMMATLALADHAWERRSVTMWGGYLVAAVATVATHLLGGVSIIFYNLWVLWARRLRGLAGWIALQAGALLVLALLFVPWLMTAGRGEGVGVAGGNAPDAITFGREVSSGLLAAPYDPAGSYWAMSGLPLLVLAATGVLASMGPRKTDRRALMCGLTVLQYGALYLLARFSDAPLYAYYLTPILPMVYLAIGRGTEWVFSGQRWLAALAVMVIVAGMGWATRAYALRPVEDLAPLTQQIANQAAPGDAIVLSSKWRAQCFRYYDHSGLPNYSEPDQEQVGEIFAHYERVWLVLFGDRPTPAIKSGLMNTGLPVGRWSSGTTQLTLYVNTPAPNDPTRALSATFGASIELVGYDLQPQAVSRSSILQLTLWWRTQQQVPGRYKVFVHLEGTDGRIWGQHDSEPADGTRPTSDWPLNKKVRDRHAVQVDPAILPGEYLLVIGLYDGMTSQRLPVHGASVVIGQDALLLEKIQVQADSR